MARPAALPRWLSTLESWADAWAERSNPLTVRLVRQQLRATSFALTFCLLLILGLCATIITLGAPNRTPLLGGRLLFVALVSLWTLIAWVIGPIILTNSIRAERQENTWDLLDLTGLRPLHILTGYLGAAAVQQGLIAAAIAPFLVLAWMVRGLDPGLMVMSLIAIPLVGVMSVAAGLQAACAPRQRKARSGAVSMGAGGVLGWLFISNGLWWSMQSGSDVQLTSSLWRGDPTAWIALLLLANAAFLGTATTLVISAMHLTHPAEDRSSAPRLMVFIFISNALVWLAIGLTQGLSMKEFLALFAAIALGRAVPFGFLALSEEYSRTPRQQSQWQVTRGWRARGHWLLAPGAASGRRCYLMITGTAVLAALLVLSWPDQASAHVTTGIRGWPSDEHVTRLATGTLAVACYATWFLVLGDGLTRWLLRRTWHRPAWQRSITLVVIAVCTCTGLLANTLIGEALPLFAPIDPIHGIRSMTIAAAHTADQAWWWIMSLLGTLSAGILAWQSTRPIVIKRLRPENF